MKCRIVTDKQKPCDIIRAFMELNSRHSRPYQILVDDYLSKLAENHASKIPSFITFDDILESLNLPHELMVKHSTIVIYDDNSSYMNSFANIMTREFTINDDCIKFCGRKFKRQGLNITFMITKILS